MFFNEFDGKVMQTVQVLRSKVQHLLYHSSYNQKCNETTLRIPISRNHKRSCLRINVNMALSLQNSNKSYTFALANELFDVGNRVW